MTQPPPTINDHPRVIDAALVHLSSFFGDTPTAHELAAFLSSRSELGYAKYGTHLQPHNDRDALQDACEELADALMYMEQAIMERGGHKELEGLWIATARILAHVWKMRG